MMANGKKWGVSAAVAIASLVAVQVASAAPVLPGYLTDPTAVKGALDKDTSYMPPERLKYPYISTYYVRPTVKIGTDVKIGIFVTDFESSKIRFLDDSHVFTAYLEYGLKGGARKIVSLKNLKSGDATFTLKDLAAGAYEMRVWAVDQKGRESHRVIHDFRVVAADFAEIPADKVYTMTKADLATYGLRNDGDVEEIVYVEAGGKSKVMKKKRAGVPGYTVTVPMDEKTGKMPFRAYQKAKVVYDAGYDKDGTEQISVANADGLQKLFDEKAAAGFRKIKVLPGTYRISHTKTLLVPDNMTIDLGTATLKQNAFTGASSCIIRLASAVDAHLVGGTLEGDYWTHNYAGSPNNAEWPAGFEIGGASQYCSVDGVKVVDITGYGGQNGIHSDKRGGMAYFMENLTAFAAGGLDPKTGAVDATDKYRFTSDFKDLKKIVSQGNRRLQVSRYLGYQGCATRSWQLTAAWYDADKNFLSAETCWQYREMWIPENAAFLRVSVEAESVKEANESNLKLTAFRLPVNCAVVRCTFDHCRSVGYAASAMKNMLFAKNFFTRSGESSACCAFDAEDGWDQMQDAYFLKNVFKENPRNNSILTCAGHNFIMEKNEGDLYFWGRTHSPCVRDNNVGKAVFRCDNRIRSGYGRFDGNRYSEGVVLGENDGKNRVDTWDYVLSGLEFDGGANSFNIEVGAAGRLVNCSFRNMAVKIANAYACRFENCTDGGGIAGCFPGGRWFEVTAKDCKFTRFFSNYAWDRCHFTNTKFEKFWGGTVKAKGSDFAGCTFQGVDSTTFGFAKCKLDKTVVRSGYWEMPANFLFRNCTVQTADDAALVSIGLCSLGKVSFEDCSVAGKQSALNISDLRPHNAAPDKNPDVKPAEISVKGMKWGSESKSVISRAWGDVTSPKKVTIKGTGNVLAEGVVLVDKLPSTWKLN